MALREHAVKIRAAEAEARKLKAEVEALEAANCQQKKSYVQIVKFCFYEIYQLQTAYQLNMFSYEI